MDLADTSADTGADDRADLPAALQVLTVDHVGIAVPDLDAAIALYTGVLGGRLAHRESNPDQEIEEAMISFGPDDAGRAQRAQLQLIAPTSPTSTIAKFIDRSGPGLQQLAYRVPDVRAAADTLRSAGLRLLYDEPRRGTAGSSINFVHPKDTGGVLLELVQSPVFDQEAAPTDGPTHG
ncbi:MAG: methylmalonyl-CoA epimerase [Nakamurella sp.]